ncbi:hypothetical protein GS39_20040 [Escherichia coli]|nr:hypothetical protein GS37_10740 [Escherichia coli]KFV35769.1 hypothetical protein GS39_20040 [Escherichia coli]
MAQGRSGVVVRFVPRADVGMQEPPKVDGWFAGGLKETALIKLKFCIQRNRSTLTISNSGTPLFDEEPE